MKLTSKWKKLIEYFLVLFITTILTYIILRIDSIKWDLPISYYWDGLAAGFEIKTILETGWWFKNPYVGAPFGTSLYDFLGFYFDSFYFFIIKIILFFTKNWGMALNMFYISLYPVTSLISYFVMRKFKISFIISLMGSLVFTFLEYRFLRGGYHLLLSAYNVIPLIVLFLYYIYTNEEVLVLSKKKFKTKKNLLAFILFLLLPTTGVYYTFFTCFFLIVILIIKNKKIEIIKKVFVAYSCMLLSIFLIYLPGIVYKLKNPANLEKPSRLVLESEYYGLRISNLFISKKIILTSRVREYFKYIMESGENSEYLGIIGIIGFLYLIYYLLKRKKTNEKIEFLSYLNVFGILLSVKSGFGVLFSIYITGLIRGYGRISVFIAYFSILTICIKINDFINNENRNKLFYNLIFIGICFFSIWDQIPQNVRYNNQAITEYDYKSSKEKYEKEFEKASHLKLVLLTGTGYNHIDLVAAKEHGVTIANVADYSTNSVSQLTMTLLLNELTRVERLSQEVKQNKWEEISNKMDRYYHVDTEGKVLGILGYGNIGKKVESYAKSFGMEVMIAKIPEREYTDNLDNRFELDEVLEKCDIFSIHAPLSDLTRDLINLDRMKKMKKSAIILNLGRSPIINEDDLYYALKNKIIASAATDVMTTEPPKKDCKLLELDNFTVTPHLAWKSLKSLERLFAEIENNLNLFLENKLVGVESR